VNPENESDSLKITITVPNVAFADDVLQEKFGKYSTDKVPNFVNDVKSFVLAYDREALKKKVEREGGVLRFKLNDV
jgi:hypothetical protein